jgi:acyl-CoA thioesterase-1
MSFMLVTGPRADRSYGWRRACIQILGATAVAVSLMAAARIETAAADRPLKVVALGDSLTAGYGLREQDGFVPRLQAALAARGVNVAIANAGVSGDTATDGLARLDWSVPAQTQAAIVELGANDMLRGIDPQLTRKALDTILQRLTARHIAVLLCGMRAAPNLGSAYGQAFEGIYPQLAAKYGVALYPFFLDGVAANSQLTQRDGMHPNAAGVGVIVARILPKVEELVVRARALTPS